ncbi:MAG: extracellular solute-binding protein [Patescibacteria group bacterium]
MRPGISSFQIILLSVFGTFAVAGVLIFAFLVGTNTGATIGEVVIWGTFDDTALSTVLRQLSETDGRLRQVTYVQKDPETYSVGLANALASGTGPDLFVLRQDETITEASKIAPIDLGQLSKEQFQALWVEGADPFWGSAGALGIPFVVDPFVLYWNRDMFATAGVATPPQYWDELFAIVRAITKRDDAGTIQKSAIALGEYANVNHAKGIVSTLIMQAGGRITGRDGAGSLVPALAARVGETSQPSESALRFYTQFANPSGTNYSWNRGLPESRVAFAQGDVALYIGPVSEEPLIRRLNPNLNFAIATSVPQIRGSDRYVDGGYAYAFAVPRASKNPGGAFTAAYLLAAPGGSQLLALALGQVSARRDILAAPAQGNDAVFKKMALLLRTWEDPNARETERIFRDMIESVTSGAAQALEAVQRAEQAMRQLTSP